MAELIVPEGRVIELTSATRRLPIEIEGSVTFEIALHIWSSFNEKDPHTTNDLGDNWHEEIRKSTGTELAQEITTLGGPWVSNWLAISSLMLSAPRPHDPDRVFDWLEALPEQRLRRWILGYHSHRDDHPLIEQAAAGDVEAAAALLGDTPDTKPELAEHLEWMLTSEGLPARFAQALRDFRREVFGEFEGDFAGAISRAAAALRAAPTRGTAKEVIEEVTSGIDFDIPTGVSRVVLIPSVITRPLSLIDKDRGTLIVYYGIADEFIDSNPEAPPSWLVRTYKALSDERRLRILRRVGESPASLDDLTELLGLTKSTVHHHIAILRGAGLVRVHVGDHSSHDKKKTYSVREQSLADAANFLDDYLRTGEEPKSV